MNWEAISAIGETIGAIAVIATLFYLAVQIRQNTRSVKASAHQTWVTTAIAELSAGIQVGASREFAEGLHNPSALTEETWVPFVNYCNLFMLKAESAYYLQKDQIVNVAVSNKEMERAAAFIGANGPAQWWEAGARTQFTDEFVKEVESRLNQESNFKVYDFTPGKGFHPHRSEE